ncbi:lysophospholipid acyltransferase 6 isoform X2 [Arctopsyche grandis]|uniref:lysophospholipid acyltransferase 6 isoform X2 n=1 Tax=Arctopsyche grandis TaxID=121162 RepID=UPI00406D69C4
MINFLMAQLFAVLVAGAMRGPLKPSDASPTTRHSICLVLGVATGYFCFGTKAIHLALLPLICFVVIEFAPQKIMANSILGIAIGYLSCIHLHRQFYLNESCNLDITGPLMVITQRVTSLAYCIHDGRVAHDNSNTKEIVVNDSDHEALEKAPSLLEFLSYSLSFQTLLCGPPLPYVIYMDFIHGRQTQDQIQDEANRQRAVGIKFCGVIIVAVLHLVLSAQYPISDLTGKAPPNWSIAYLLWFCYAATLAVRCKYYLAWLLADIVCNCAGIGYQSPGKWDRVTNVNIIEFESASTFREAVASWNMGTNSWLRMVVYNRVRSAKLLKTYALSAIWHGFYPGYYLTFGTGALFTLAARKVRRFAQPFAWSSSRLYSALAFALCRIFMTYATVPFVLLDFAPSIALYRQVYFSLHWVALGALLLPSPKLKKITTKSTNGEANHENGKVKTG